MRRLYAGRKSAIRDPKGIDDSTKKTKSESKKKTPSVRHPLFYGIWRKNCRQNTPPSTGKKERRQGRLRKRSLRGLSNIRDLIGKEVRRWKKKNSRT